jgi:hypothetical protein
MPVCSHVNVPSDLQRSNECPSTVESVTGEMCLPNCCLAVVMCVTIYCLRITFMVFIRLCDEQMGHFNEDDQKDCYCKVFVHMECPLCHKFTETFSERMDTTRIPRKSGF